MTSMNTTASRRWGTLWHIAAQRAKRLPCVSAGLPPGELIAACVRNASVPSLHYWQRGLTLPIMGSRIGEWVLLELNLLRLDTVVILLDIAKCMLRFKRDSRRLGRIRMILPSIGFISLISIRLRLFLTDCWMAGCAPNEFFATVCLLSGAC